MSPKASLDYLGMFMESKRISTLMMRKFQQKYMLQTNMWEVRAKYSTYAGVMTLKMKVLKLKDALAARSLPKKGSKVDLIRRLKQADDNEIVVI